MFSHELISSAIDEEQPLRYEFKEKIKFAYGSDCRHHAMLVTETGEVYLKGYIGNYFFNDFTKLNNISNIKFAGCGGDYIILIDENNKVYGCGSDYGQFGSGCEVLSGMVESIDADEFQEFMTIKENIKFITCGSEFTIIVTKDNNILFGGNSSALNGTVESIKGYKLIENTPRVDIKDIKVGYYHTILLDSFGNIYGSGKNNDGQLGFENSITHLENFTKLNTPCKVKAIHCTTNGTLILSYYNEIYGCGFGSNKIGFTRINLSNQIGGTIYSFKFMLSSLYFTTLLINDKFYKIKTHSFLDNEIDMKKSFEFTKNWPYKNVFVRGKTTFYIGSDYRINGTITNKIKIYKRLYLQLLNNENPFFDLFFTPFLKKKLDTLQ
ncbi:hypothetical protein ABK040_008957 [Willaertia magna]